MIILSINNMNEDKVNIVDKVTNDNTKIVITNKSVKWVIGLLSAGVIGLLGLAWGLYLKIDAKVDEKYDELNTNMVNNKTEIINKIDELDKGKVEKTQEKNYAQDLDIVRLYERTNSKQDNLNGHIQRPAILNDETTSKPSLNNN